MGKGALRERFTPLVGVQLVACGAWVGLLFAVSAITDDGNAQAAILIGGTLALGLLVGRWWVLAIPLALFVVTTLYGAISGSYSDPGSDNNDLALGIALLIVAEFLLAVPVAFRTVARRLSDG